MTDQPDQVEDESLTACALRFDGHAFIDRTGFAAQAAIDRFTTSGASPDDRGQLLAMLFILQRSLLKWTGPYWPRTGPEWWAIRTLFLRLWETGVPSEYLLKTDAWAWDALPADERAARVRAVAALHAATVYERPVPQASGSAGSTRSATPFEG